MEEIFINRIKNIPLKKNIDYVQSIKLLFEFYHELDNMPLYKNLKYKVTNEYNDGTIILELTTENKKNEKYYYIY